MLSAPFLFLKTTSCSLFLNILLCDHPAHFPPDTIPTPVITTSAPRPLSFRICTQLSLRADPPVILKQLLHGAHFWKMSLSWLLSLPAKLITLRAGLPLRVCELRPGNWDGFLGVGGPARAPKSAPVEPDGGTVGMDCCLVLSCHFSGATTWRVPVLS